MQVLVKLVLAKRKIGTNACGVCERMLRIKLPKEGTTVQSTFALRDPSTRPPAKPVNCTGYKGLAFALQLNEAL